MVAKSEKLLQQRFWSYPTALKEFSKIWSFSLSLAQSKVLITSDCLPQTQKAGRKAQLFAFLRIWDHLSTVNRFVDGLYHTLIT